MGTAGTNVRFAYLQETGRVTYMAVNRETGGFAAWLNGCKQDSLIDVPDIWSCKSRAFSNATGNWTTGMGEEMERRKNRDF